MATFIFNDETVVNSYGFRVRNADGSFGRFDSNPVMLNSHENTTATTLGSWQNRRMKGAQILGDTNFDMALNTAKEVSGQVDRGFIKGCSMGLTTSFDVDAWQQAPDGIWECVKWELMEVSICAVPSNAASVQLYNRDGVKLNESAVKSNIIKLNAGNIMNNPFAGGAPDQLYANIKTAADFMNLSDSQKKEFHDNHNLAYKEIWSKTKGSNVATLNYEPASILTKQDFYKLSAAEALDFKNNHNAAYTNLWLKPGQKAQPTSNAALFAADYSNRMNAYYKMRK